MKSDVGTNKKLEPYSNSLYDLVNRNSIGVLPIIAVIIAVVVVVVSAVALIYYFTLPDRAEAIGDYQNVVKDLKELEQYIPADQMPKIMQDIKADAKNYGMKAYNDGYAKATLNAFGGVLKYGFDISSGRLAANLLWTG